MTTSKKIVGFYSYNDGTIRNSYAMSCAHLLADQGQRVLLIDCDSESPGVQFSSEYYESLQNRPGLLQLLLEDRIKEILDSAFIVQKFHRPPALQGSLRIIPAAQIKGVATADMVNDLDNVSYQKETARFQWKSFIEYVISDKEIDVVLLIISRGYSEFSGLLANSCNHLVITCGLNNQDMLGTFSVIDSLPEPPRDSLLLVTSPAPSNCKGLEEAYNTHNIIFKDVSNKLSIPYCPVVSITDSPLDQLTDFDFRNHINKLVEALRKLLGMDVTDILNQINRLLSMKKDSGLTDLLVELLRIRGVERTLQDEGTTWSSGKVPIQIAKSLKQAMDILKSLGENISNESWLVVAKLWVYKLGFCRPSEDSVEVLALYQYLTVRQLIMVGGLWIPGVNLRECTGVCT